MSDSSRVDPSAAWWTRHRQFMLFVLAAGASVPVNLAARVALSHWMRFEVAVVLSHLVGMVTAYGLTKLFVFEKTGRSVRSELGRFAIVNVVSVVLTWLVSVGVLKLVFIPLRFNHHPELLAHVIGLGFASVSSFIGHRSYSFQRSASS